jgi:hypothetical protein
MEAGSGRPALHYALFGSGTLAGSYIPGSVRAEIARRFQALMAQRDGTSRGILPARTDGDILPVPTWRDTPPGAAFVYAIRVSMFPPGCLLPLRMKSALLVNRLRNEIRLPDKMLLFAGVIKSKASLRNASRSVSGPPRFRSL